MESKNKLKRGLSTRHIRFMVLGSAIGTGLFYGSADAIARNLIDQHSGKIEFTSWPGHTEFSVYLPIRK